MEGTRDLRYCDQYYDVRMGTHDVDEYKDDYVDDGDVRPRRMLVWYMLMLSFCDGMKVYITQE